MQWKNQNKKNAKELKVNLIKIVCFSISDKRLWKNNKLLITLKKHLAPLKFLYFSKKMNANQNPKSVTESIYN